LIYQLREAFCLVLKGNSDTKVEWFKVSMKPDSSVRNKSLKLTLLEISCTNPDENTCDVQWAEELYRPMKNSAFEIKLQLHITSYHSQ